MSLVYRLAVQSYKRTSNKREQNVSSVLYGNLTNNETMCISASSAAPVKVEEETNEPLKLEC